MKSDLVRIVENMETTLERLVFENARLKKRINRIVTKMRRVSRGYRSSRQLRATVRGPSPPS